MLAINAPTTFCVVHIAYDGKGTEAIVDSARCDLESAIQGVRASEWDNPLRVDLVDLNTGQVSDVSSEVAHSAQARLCGDECPDSLTFLFDSIEARKADMREAA